jgi:hypothetical protein
MSDTIKDALMILIQENGARGASARRYPSVKRALRAIGIEENSDGWHEVLYHLGYHDREKRGPYKWVIPKPRPTSYRIRLVDWRRRGRVVDDRETQGYQLSDYAREANIKLDGYKKAGDAQLAARKLVAKPDKDGIYPNCEPEPIHE